MSIDPRIQQCPNCGLEDHPHQTCAEAGVAECISRHDFHDYAEFIDPRSGGFMRCKRCGHAVDCEDPDGDLG